MNVWATFKQVLEMSWLWDIFAGFYLVAYVFWVPRVLSGLAPQLVLSLLTLVVGLGLLADGFLRAQELQAGSTRKTLPLRRLRELVGGLLLVGYLLVYIPPQGRIVAHWPLDLAITAVSGVILLGYAALNR